MRLFAAIELAPDVRRELARRVAEARESFPPASWVREENFHLTLAFFGEVDGPSSTTLADALAEAASGGPALELRTAGAGAFPPSGPVRVVWVALEPAAELAGLAARLREAAAGVGVDSDRKPFTSHVTLARARRPWPAATRGGIATLAPRAPIACRAESASLVASDLGAGAPRYRAVARLPFAEAA